MPNLMITTSCNLQCEYCFAVDMMNGKQAGQAMDWSTFISILDWIDRGNVPELTIQLMGGEPTLSPILSEIIEELTDRSRKIIIFSNGTLPLAGRVVELTKSAGVEWVININHGSVYSANQKEILDRNLTLLGQAASLNVNFYSKEISYDHLFEYIESFDVKRLIKVGIALPTSGKTNRYVSTEMFQDLGEKLGDFVAKADERNVKLTTECGVPTCLFRDLVKKHPTVFLDNMISHCGSRLDITPEGVLINCLPLSKVASVRYDSFSDYARASRWFHEFLSPYRALGGIDLDCYACSDLGDGNCMVCIANSIDEFDHLPKPPLPALGD